MALRTIPFLSNRESNIYKRKANMSDNFEYYYADALQRVFANGVLCHNRTGIDTKSVQHQAFVIKDACFSFPILRGKKVYPYMALKELIWMLMGRTDVKWLNEHGVTYWDKWALEDGTIGKSYGYQYRKFGDVDQVKTLVNDIVKDPMSRRHIVNLWNAADLKDMALPPCQYDYHFCCIPNRESPGDYYIDLHAHMRSADSFLGVPYNFMFSSFFLLIVANYCSFYCEQNEIWNTELGDGKLFPRNYVPRNVYTTCDDFHMYVNHEDAVKQYLANVEENKDDIIDTTTSVHFNVCNLKNAYPDGVWHDVNFDIFLHVLEDDLKKHKIIDVGHPFREMDEEHGIGVSTVVENPDVYGPIKADVAV